MLESQLSKERGLKELSLGQIGNASHSLALITASVTDLFLIKTLVIVDEKT